MRCVGQSSYVRRLGSSPLLFSGVWWGSLATRRGGASREWGDERGTRTGPTHASPRVLVLDRRARTPPKRPRGCRVLHRPPARAGPTSACPRGRSASARLPGLACPGPPGRCRIHPHPTPHSFPPFFPPVPYPGNRGRRSLRGRPRVLARGEVCSAIPNVTVGAKRAMGRGVKGPGSQRAGGKKSGRGRRAKGVCGLRTVELRLL